jgi:hypothetical protein
LSDRTVEIVTRRNPLQAKVLSAFGVDTGPWETPRIS